jgi:hypothetical protein
VDINTIIVVGESFWTHEFMITAACGGNISMSSDLSTEPRYRRCDLINLCEHCDGREPGFYARGDDWMEDEESHWRCRSVDIDMGFLDEHCKLESGECVTLVGFPLVIGGRYFVSTFQRVTAA